MTAKWIFQPTDPNGGAEGAAFWQIFNGAALPPEDLLMREAIQNSVDAKADGVDRVVVGITARSLAGADRAAFVEAAGLAEILRRAGPLRLRDASVLGDPERPLRVLYVADRGTTGLAGDPTEQDSNLRKLLMEVGGSRKPDGGGSFGFGKAVWSGSSNIATIFVYSRTTDAAGAPLSVLMGCGYHHGFYEGDTGYSGRAFFGRIGETSTGLRRHDPYIGAEADDLAERLGLARPRDDIGTTMAIVDCRLDLDALRAAAETWWWPAWDSDSLRVEFEDDGGARNVLRPRRRPDLAPFLEAWETMTGVAGAVPGKTAGFSLNRHEGRNLGSMGFTALPEDEVDAKDDDDTLGRRNTIALTRNPGMVVRYFTKNQWSHPPVVGVYRADAGIDGVLRASEPPEHDKWSDTADRLIDQADKDLVAAVLKRTWDRLKRFQREARPPPSTTPARLSDAERMLAKYLGPDTKRPSTSPGRGDTPVSMRLQPKVRADGGSLSAGGTLDIGLQAGEPAVDVSISLHCEVIDAEGKAAGEKVAVIAADSPFDIADGVACADLDLIPGERWSVAFETEPYPSDLTVRIVPIATPRREEGAP
ncbi:MAG: hypothetical protein ACU0CO_17675 [Shimia sp.]